MRTHTHPMDYGKPIRALTTDEQAINERPLAEIALDLETCATLGKIGAAYDRGEITRKQWMARRQAALNVLAEAILRMREEQAGQVLADVDAGKASIHERNT